MNDENLDPNKKNYFNNLTKQENDKLYKNLHEEKIEITLWEKQDEDNADKFITAGIEKDLTVALTQEKSFFTKKQDSSLIGKSVLIKFSIKNDSFFANGKLSKRDDKLILLLKKIFIHKKRKNFRLEACKAIEIQFKIDDEVFNALDISAGGTCFITEKIHISRFQKGSKFTECKLRINRERFEIPQVQVLKAVEYQDSNRTEKLKVALEFIKLPESIDVKLSKLIHIEARGLLMALEF